MTKCLKGVTSDCGNEAYPTLVIHVRLVNHSENLQVVLGWMWWHMNFYLSEIASARVIFQSNVEIIQ